MTSPRLALLLAGALAPGLVGAARAAAAPAPSRLTAVEVRGSGASAEVQFHITGPLPSLVTQVDDRGHRLVVELPGVVDATAEPTLEVGLPAVQRVWVGSRRGGIAVIVEGGSLFDPQGPRGLLPTDDGFIVTLGPVEPAVAEADAGQGEPPPPVLPAPPETTLEPMEVAPAPPSSPEAPAPPPAPRPLRLRLPGTREPRDREAEIRGPTAAALPTPVYEVVSIPDRWRLIESLGVGERPWDPYHQNTLKADRPLPGTQHWFANLALVSDTVVEPRRLPTPVGAQANRGSGSLGAFGDGKQLAVVENLIASLSLIEGDTVFRPPDYEFRFTPIGNVNYTEVEELGVLFIDPAEGRERTDWQLGLGELFLDKHLRNKSDRYDFDSLRIGVQPFTSDFRSFLFQDNALGTRLFGTFANNRLQYNLAWFRRLEKDTNSGLNEWFKLRDDDVAVANLYYQDFPVLGFTTQGIVAWNRNREGDDTHYNENGFLERPAPVGDGRAHDYDVVYLGLNGDGHLGRLNLTYSGYYAVGHDDHNPLPGRSQTISAGFAAAEASVDFDWYRIKAFGLFASGDEDPFDGHAEGFDAISENPDFAGADTSFFQRQAIPLIAGGGVVLSARNALLPALRTSKEEGQSNFVNPGLGLVGVGADFDILPELRLVANASWLSFIEVAPLQVLRNQLEIDHEIGWDLSAGLVYRPLFIQNVVLRSSGAVLIPGQGLRDLFSLHNTAPFYSVLVNLILTY